MIHRNLFTTLVSVSLLTLGMVSCKTTNSTSKTASELEDSTDADKLAATGCPSSMCYGLEGSNMAEFADLMGTSVSIAVTDPAFYELMKDSIGTHTNIPTYNAKQLNGNGMYEPYFQTLGKRVGGFDDRVLIHSKLNCYTVGLNGEEPQRVCSMAEGSNLIYTGNMVPSFHFQGRRLHKATGEHEWEFIPLANQMIRAFDHHKDSDAISISSRDATINGQSVKVWSLFSNEVGVSASNTTILMCWQYEDITKSYCRMPELSGVSAGAE